jgi:hypothetical protein
MDNVWPSFAEIPVRVISLPLPPVKTRNGTIYMPDAFTSKSFDRSFNRSKEFDVISMIHSEYGPAILAEVPLRVLISYTDKGIIEGKDVTICAKVSYYNFVEENGIQFVDKIDIENLNLIHSSCHPGSHFVVPQAPHLTSILQYSQSSYRDVSPDVLYVSPDDGEKLFPQWTWKMNSVVDNFVRSCVIENNVSYFKLSGGLGKWASPILRNMRNNALKTKEEFHASLWYSQIHGRKSQENGGILASSSNPISVNEVVQV